MVYRLYFKSLPFGLCLIVTQLGGKLPNSVTEWPKVTVALLTVKRYRNSIWPLANDAITLKYDDYWKELQGPHTVLLHCFHNRTYPLFHSFYLREVKIPDGNEDDTKLKRRWHDFTNCPRDSLAKGKMDTRISHENIP